MYIFSIQVAHLLGKNADIMFLHLLTFLYEIQSPEVMQASFQHLDQTLVAIVVGANLAEKQVGVFQKYLVSLITATFFIFFVFFHFSYKSQQTFNLKFGNLHSIINNRKLSRQLSTCGFIDKHNTPKS